MPDYTARLTLDTARQHVGEGVVYHPGTPGQPLEDGQITSVSSTYVFVRFTGEQGAKACRPVDLELSAWSAP